MSLRLETLLCFVCTNAVGSIFWTVKGQSKDWLDSVPVYLTWYQSTRLSKELVPRLGVVRASLLNYFRVQRGGGGGGGGGGCNLADIP